MDVFNALQFLAKRGYDVRDQRLDVFLEIDKQSSTAIVLVPPLRALSLTFQMHLSTYIADKLEKFNASRVEEVVLIARGEKQIDDMMDHIALQ